MVNKRKLEVLFCVGEISTSDAYMVCPNLAPFSCGDAFHQSHQNVRLHLHMTPCPSALYCDQSYIRCVSDVSQSLHKYSTMESNSSM